MQDLHVLRLRTIVLGLAITACSIEPEGEGVLVAEAVVSPPTRCDGLALDARRDYRPKRVEDGHLVFGDGPLSFAIPAEIPVTIGDAGHGKVVFTFGTGAGVRTTCTYRGSPGRPYALARCRVGDAADEACDHDDAPKAGSPALADTFMLHVQQGDRRFPATAVQLALPGPADASACRGETNFHDRTLAGLGGNGRACADCHVPADSFQLSPARALARFTEMTRTGTDDPLFRPIDADDFRSNGPAARDFTNLIENGLVRVTIPLPPNVKLLDCGAAIPCPASARPTGETVADIWRAVPSIFDVRITGPDGVGPAWPRGANPRGGYQLDGRIDTLEHQALAALRSHAGTTLDPAAGWLTDVARFEDTQFSSPRVRLLADAMAAGSFPLPEPDPVLDALAAQGRVVFDRACGHCHGNLADHPSGSTPIQQGTPGTPTALVRYHSITTACPRPVDTVVPARFTFAACSASQLENVRTYEITNSGAPPTGTPCGGPAPQPPCVTRLTTSDPGRLLLTGYPAPGGPGDIEHMDIPSLRGLARTAPYFSNNTAATLEAVVDHYQQFFRRVAIQAPGAPLLTTQPGVVPPVHDRPFTDAETAALLAYLRVL